MGIGGRSLLEEVVRIGQGFYIDFALSIGEVIGRGLGCKVTSSGASYFVTVALRSGQDAVFVLNQAEYHEWLAHRADARNVSGTNTASRARSEENGANLGTKRNKE